MSLANIQHAFMLNLIESKQTRPDFISKLLPVGTLTQEKQLSIYRANIKGAYQKVLAQIYPACLNILGEKYFNQLCSNFCVEYPSTQADLNFYGAQFPEFIKKHIDSNAELKDYEYLEDLAFLEWHWHASYYADNDPLFSFENFALVNPEVQGELVFILSNAFSLHKTPYPLLDIWHANKEDIENKQEFIMPEEELYFCLSRVGFSVKAEVLNYGQYAILNAIVNKIPLALLTEVEVGYVDCFNDFLVDFIQRRWITGFYFPDTKEL